MGNPGFVVWFTGLSGAGKSTLATRLADELRARGEHVELLDGDEVRTHLSKGLGFSRADRDTNVLRIGFVARLVARAGACAITAAISPYRAARGEVRAKTERFLEVWCRAPLDALAARDPKGLYLKAMRGEISGFTGVDDPYEEPTDAEVVCDTADEDAETSLLRVLDALADRGWIGRSLGAVSPRGEPGALEAVPHGGMLEERVAAATRREELAVEARTLVSLPLDEASEALLDAFATGLLSPLRGFPTEREDHAIERERRLERGIPWPSRLVLSAPGEHPAAGAAPGTSIALVGREGGAKAVLDVAETFASEGTTALAGEVTVLRVREDLASASSTRATLVAAGRRRVCGLVARGAALDPAVVRAALLLGDALLIATVGAPADLDSLDLLPADRRRIHTVRIARLPTRGPRDAVLEAIALKNLGASCALLDPVAFAGPGELHAERALRTLLVSWPRAALGIDVVVLGSSERDARAALEAMAPLALPAGLLDEVAAAHRVGRRAYHDLSHVAEVVRGLGEAHGRLGAPPPAESLLAALFHDAVYEAGKPDNEARSAELARAAIAQWLPDAGIDVDRVARLVALTARHGRVAVEEIDAFAALFLDADMAILAAAPEVFDRYDQAVAWEYARAVSPEAWQTGRRRFLEGLLAAPRIFLGDDAHARLDAPARENLRRALAAVS